MSKRIGDAFAKGKLHYRGQDRICFGDLARWAQDAWPGDFREWPAIRPHVANPLPGTARLPPIRATGTGRVLQADTVDAWRNYATGLESKYEELHDAYLKLFFECDDLRQEIERLRAYEKKAEQTREKKRQAGMKGGRGRSWEKSK